MVGLQTLNDEYTSSNPFYSYPKINCSHFNYCFTRFSTLKLRISFPDGYKFFKSVNNVILCSGNEHGYLPPFYFSKVVTNNRPTNNRFVNHHPPERVLRGVKVRGVTVGSRGWAGIHYICGFRGLCTTDHNNQPLSFFIVCKCISSLLYLLLSLLLQELKSAEGSRSVSELES